MKTDHFSSKSVNRQRGFSLIEMLMVIALIGVLVAMAVPLVAQVTHEASATTHQRNAQSLAALANQAVAAGDLTIPAAGSVEEVVDLLLAGVDGEGVFEGTVFRLDMLDAEDKAGAMRLLTLDSGILLYDPEQ